jgi:nicotinate-nucleotide--dimethylbenzimidazole phosphoribosyltransferase
MHPITTIADPALQAQLRYKLDHLTKPRGSLGALEALALQIGLIQGTTEPELISPQLLVFAGDHGLAHAGVSAYPQDVTWQMVENIRAGGAAVSVLAAQHGIALTVVDAGVAHDFAPSADLRDAKIARGTAASNAGAAMTATQFDACLEQGRAAVAAMRGNVLLCGEMGIGNTSAASLITARLLGLPLASVVGRGTGLDDAGLQRKVAVLEQALAINAAAQSPAQVMAAFGGFEMAQMSGAFLQAAAERRVVLIDGFICSAALLVAARLEPAVLDYCVFTHHGAEPGHAALLSELNATPLLSLGLRLGEGSGAALAYPLVVSAVALLNRMASFASAGVSDKT